MKLQPLLRAVTGSLFLTAPTLRAQCPDGTPPPCSRARAPAPTNVAVLSFANRSRDSSDAFLAEGLADEIATRLAQVGRLTVVSRSQVRRLHGAEAMGIPALGRALNSANLVTGSVQGSSTRLRVSVELMRAASAVQIWANVYDRSRTDLLDIQTDIATQVATAIAGTLRPGERATLARAPTRSPQALEHIMRGNMLGALRSTDRLSRAITEFRAAVHLDSTSATAHAKLAWAYNLCWYWNRSCLGMPRDTLLALAERAADRALRLDSASADAWHSWARVLSVRTPPDAAGSRRAAQRAVTLDSTSAESWQFLGYLLMTSCDDSGATRAFRRALRIEPTLAATYEHLSRLSVAARRFAEARALLDSATAFEPEYPGSYTGRAQLAAYLGDTAAVRGIMAAYDRIEPSPNRERSLARLEVFAVAAAGDTARARAMTDSLLAADSTGDRSNLWLAMWRMGRIEQFARLVGLGDPTPGRLNFRAGWFASRMPWWDPIRSDPRIQRLIEADRRVWEIPR